MIPIQEQTVQSVAGACFPCKPLNATRNINCWVSTRLSPHAAVVRHLIFAASSLHVLVMSVLLLSSSRAIAQPPEPVDFGRQIQPILARRCYACHGPDKAEGDLRFNRKETVFSALKSGKLAVVPHDLSGSELIRRVTSTDDSDRMPPEGPPLTPSQIGLLKTWIEQGADWKEHWAFDAPRSQPLPAVKNERWVRNPIDAFVLSKLESRGLNPAPPAEKAALLRRVTFDLTGLPPTLDELKSFVGDESSNAYEKVVDRLLQSEHFGEHQARHWLDVVRYADTNSFERDGPKPNAWRYRDYVIRSFNRDKPYDRFIKEQLAGDELPDGGNDGLIATGFYRLGQWDDEPADRLLAGYDVLDDIITTTAQGFLGLTVNCARCHDHKIDPVPQRDYYSLLAFFKGVTPNGNSNPHVERPVFETDAEKVDYDTAMKAHKDKLRNFQATITAIEIDFRKRVGSTGAVSGAVDLCELQYRFYRDSWESLPNFENLKPETVGKLDGGFFDLSPATRETSFGFVFEGTLVVPADGDYEFSLDSDDGSRLTVAGVQVVLYDGIHSIGQSRSGKISLKQGPTPIRLDYFQGGGGKGLTVTWAGPGFERKLLSEPNDNRDASANRRKHRQEFESLIASKGPTVLGASIYEEYKSFVHQLEELRNHKVEPPSALCVTESGPNPPETMLLKRGNPQSPGEKVVPAFLTILGGDAAVIPTAAAGATTSGRRTALANWIASSTNRLTARVMVNRIWQHHFGRGIVRSPNNFGLLGDPPTHLELLDWLALDFMRGSSATEGGNSSFSGEPWSIKRMHKQIVMSSTYRMSSRTAGDAASAKDGSRSTSLSDAIKVDPLNNLFWRHDMRRLSAEEVRDSILAVSGQFNSKMYGPGVFPEISDEVKAGQSVPGSGWSDSSPEDRVRRSVYVQVKRSMVLPILSDFDFADTDSSCAARFTTTQPTQALGMLNGKLLNEQAVAFAWRLRKEAGTEVYQQVSLGCRLALEREPDESMIRRSLQLIDALKTKHGLSSEKALEQFCLMIFNLNEFVYLD